MRDLNPLKVRWGRTLAALTLIVTTASLFVLALVGEWEIFIDGYVLHNAVIALGFGALGWLVLPSQPKNRAVWALTWGAAFAALLPAAFALFRLTAPPELFFISPEVDIGVLSPSQLPPGAALAFSPAAWAWVPAFLLPMTLGLLYLPDGNPPSPRWRWVAWYSILTIVAASLALAWLARPSSTVPIDEAGTAGGVAGTVANTATTLSLIGVILSVAALVVRYRRSAQPVRHQIRWVALGGSALAVAAATSILVSGVAGSGSTLTGYLLLFGELLFVGSFALAITRYRLYDVDLVINKTFVYGTLAAFIAGVYVILVVGVGTLLGQSDEAGWGLSIAATIVVAVAFQPARRRVQHWANRLVYGERSTPYEVLSSFSRRAAEVDESEFVDRVPQLVVDGTGASSAIVWTRAGEMMEPRAYWPEPSARRPLPVARDRFDDPEADLTLPILHDGELLGALSLLTGRGEAITPTEMHLLESLASALGITLRNTLLTEELRTQIAELEASRERILAAADDARRSLELDLDSGPLQQLVALKVKLGPTRLRAEQAGALQTSRVIAQLEQDAGAALRAVRDLAGGIYPPLLEADGIGAAIAQETRESPIPVRIHLDHVARYSREIEAAIYFCVLEAVQNAVKYSEADGIEVRVEGEDDILVFSVSDDGRGFETSNQTGGAGLSNMSDRIDAVGGVLSIESSPGRGTKVVGQVPLPHEDDDLPDPASSQALERTSMLNSDLATNPMAPAERAGRS